jgi:hypothetical protein
VPVIRLGLAVALVGLASSCGGNAGSTNADAGSDGSDARASADVGAPGSCLQIRACASACADAACVQRCIEQGSAPARAIYAQLDACTRAACAGTQEEICRCEAECVFPGACTDLQDMCSEGVDDPQCVRCF